MAGGKDADTLHSVSGCLPPIDPGQAGIHQYPGWGQLNVSVYAGQAASSPTKEAEQDSTLAPGRPGSALDVAV
jgi:hypothetical protein